MAKPRALVLLLVCFLVSSVTAMEFLTPGWIPTFKEDAVSSSSISWSYSNYTAALSKRYSSVQSKALSDDECEELCSGDTKCVGYSLKENSCFVYTRADDPDSVAVIDFAKTPQVRSFASLYVINRKVPPSGWQVVLHLSGASLRQPADALKVDNTYTFNITTSAMTIEFSPLSLDAPTIEAQFVLLRRNVARTRSISSAAGENTAAAVSISVFFLLGGLAAFVRVKLDRIGHRGKGDAALV